MNVYKHDDDVSERWNDLIENTPKPLKLSLLWLSTTASSFSVPTLLQNHIFEYNVVTEVSHCSDGQSAIT